MASLLIAALISFFAEEKKSIERGENHYRSEHIESFTYNQGVLRGEVHASMKKKVYTVTESLELLIVLRSRSNLCKYLPSAFLFSYLLPEFRISKIYVFDFVDFHFLHQVKQAEAYFAKKKSYRWWFNWEMLPRHSWRHRRLKSYNNKRQQLHDKLK